MKIRNHEIRLPGTKQEWHHKMDHLTHSTYVGAESVLGHGVLQYAAWAMLVVLILGVLWHVEA